MIRQDYIENEINRLGVQDFDLVVGFMLNTIMRRNFVNINGNGDGGCDFKSFETESDHCLACQHEERYGAEIIQVTVQDQRWKTKAVNDALKAKKNYKDMAFYLFFTSRTRKSTELTKLGDEIKRRTGIYDVQCMCAREIAGQIFESNTFPQLMAQLGRPVHDNIVGRPEPRLRFLHTFYAFFGTRDKLRKEMFDVAIFSILKMGPKTKETLKEDVARFLSRPDAANEIGSRIDALRSADKIVVKDRALSLGEECKAEMVAAETCYLQGLEELRNGAETILRRYFPEAELSDQTVCDLAFLLAKIFVKKESLIINRNSLSRVIPFVDGSFENLEINRFLIEHKFKKADLAREELIDLASNNLLVQRLADAVAYAWMDYYPNPCSNIAMGVYDWTKLDIIVDTNVALPYLLARLFVPTKDRYSDAIVTSLNSLIEKGCSVSVPEDYLGECAGHLWSARNFKDIVEGYEDVLKYSENAFVAHYCQMHEMEVESCPESFEAYLSMIHKGIWGSNNEWSTLRSSYVRTVKTHFTEAGISSFPEYRDEKDEQLKKRLETEYAYQMEARNREGRKGLMNHDIRVLMHLIDGSTNNTEIFVTIDKVVHSVFNKNPPEMSTRLLLMPDEFCDILKPSNGNVMSEDRLRAVAFTYAKVENPKNVYMRVFFEEFARFSKLSGIQQRNVALDLLDKYMRTQGVRNQSVDDETARMRAKAFLKEHGIDQECDPGREDSI